MKFTGADGAEALLLKLRARIAWNFFELSSWRVLNFLCDQRRSLSLHQSLLNTRGWTYDRHNEPSLGRKSEAEKLWHFLILHTEILQSSASMPCSLSRRAGFLWPTQGYHQALMEMGRGSLAAIETRLSERPDVGPFGATRTPFRQTHHLQQRQM